MRPEILRRWQHFKDVGRPTGWQAAERFRKLEFDEYLDVGCGRTEMHHDLIQRPYKTTDLFPPADFVGDYLTINTGRVWQAIWCNHVLEHQLDVHRFLLKLHADLAIGGVLCITVPPAHPEFMGGHVSLWTEGLLVYRLVLAGFDCSQARVGVYDRNITVIVEKTECEIPRSSLTYDIGDVDKLAHLFPLPVNQWSTMLFGSVNWD